MSTDNTTSLWLWNRYPFSFEVILEAPEGCTPKRYAYYPLDGAKDARDLARRRMRLARESGSLSLISEAYEYGKACRVRMRKCAMDFRAALAARSVVSELGKLSAA